MTRRTRRKVGRPRGITRPKSVTFRVNEDELKRIEGGMAVAEERNREAFIRRAVLLYADSLANAARNTSHEQPAPLPDVGGFSG